MNEKPNELPPEPNAASPAEPQPASDATATPDAAAAAAARIEELDGQIRDLTDRLLRAHAEMDNVRKRSEREKQDTAKYAITKFARDIVGVADNFQRAVAAAAQETEPSPAMQSLIDGVNMTERELLNVLERNGVRRVDPKGEIFNPHLHQAVMEQNNVEVVAGTILQVFQSGYVIEDRVLRPAMVVVATGGAKSDRKAEDQPTAPPAEGTSSAG